MQEGEFEPQNAEQRQLLWLARMEIEYLRRMYAHATDLLGRIEDQSGHEEAKKIYHRIFTPDVNVSVVGTAQPLSGVGPDAWVDVVVNALGPYKTTQHLIGSQLATIEHVEFSGSPGTIVAGKATLKSYLQAWHVWPDDRLRVVMGTYFDKVVFTSEAGWQINDMTLEHSITEHRMLGTLT